MFDSPRTRLLAMTLGGLLAAFLLVIASLWVAQRGEVLPNTSVAGVEVGGLGEQEVRARLAGLVDEREQLPVVMSFEDEEHELHPSEIDFGVDLGATVEAALSRGRTGLPGDIPARVSSLWRERDLAVVDGWDEDALDTWVETTADGIDRDESVGSVAIDPETLEIDAELPHGMAEVRREEMRERIVTGLVGDGPREFDLPVDTTDQPVDDAVVTDAAERAREAVDAPLVLRVEDLSLTLEPSDLARLIRVRPTADEEALELVVTEDTVDEVLTERASATFDLRPRSATYTIGRTPPVEFDEPSDATFTPVRASVGIEPGRDGRRFIPAAAADQLTELIRESAREAQLRVRTVEPDLPNDDAEEQRPTHLIGTFTTYYQADQTRNTNIQLLADVIDGTTVLPGEQFSINDVSGERSCDKGYEPAGTIIRGELVDTCGGGTSQFGTTTFNAAFFAGVQLDQWKAHSWYISRYPMGREATLSYPQLDVRFTNTTDGAILVKTDHTDTSVTVSLYGQPLADRVVARHGSPTDERPYRTETRSTSELRRGQERVVQSGTDGFTVRVTRVVARADGSNDRQHIDTVYSPQTRIIERGSR
jgi:vancomycin resistance protein YoaR